MLDIISLYRKFHKIPEYGDKLPRTKKLVCQTLDMLGIPYTCFDGHDTVIAEIVGEKPGKTVAYRADMDALHIKEDTGLPYASEAEGYMHACGHDAHTAIALCAAENIQKNRENLCGRVRFLFEAGEETGVGALHLLEENALADVDGVFSLHVGTLAGRDVESGTFVILPTAVSAGKDTFSIEIKGVGGHGAYPSEALDPIRIASQLITAMQSIVSMEVPSGSGAVITFGSIHGGKDNNSVPDSVTLTGTVRTQSEAVRGLIGKRIREIADTLPRAFGTTATCDLRRGSNAVVNDPRLAQIAADAVAAVFGEERVIRSMQKALMGSDDFARLAERVPGVYFFLSTANQEKGTDHPNHNAKFTIDEAVLADGVRAVTAILTRYTAE